MRQWKKKFFLLIWTKASLSVSWDQYHSLLWSATCPPVSLETKLSDNFSCDLSVSVHWNSAYLILGLKATLFLSQEIDCHSLLRSAACPSLSLETCFFRLSRLSRLSRLWRPVSPASSIGSMSVSFPWDLFLPSLPSLETSVACFFDRQHVRLFPLRPVSSVSPVSGDQCRPLLRSAACPSLSLETCFFRLSRLWRPVSPASSIGSMSVSFPWDLFLPSLPSLETSVACFFDRQHVRLFPLRPVSSVSPVSGDQCRLLLRSAACPSLSLETCFFRLSRLWRPVSPASSIGSMSVSFPWDLFLPSLPSLETSVARFFDRQHVRLFPLRPVSSVSPVSGDQCRLLLRSAACPYLPLRPVSSVSPVSGDQCRPLLRSAACPSLSLETCFFRLSRLWRPVSPASSIGSMSVSFPWDLFLPSLPSLETSVARFFDRQHVRLFPLRPVSSVSPVSGDQCHPLLRSAACPSLFSKSSLPFLFLETWLAGSFERSSYCLRLDRPRLPVPLIGSMSVSILKHCLCDSLVQKCVDWLKSLVSLNRMSDDSLVR